MIPIYYVISEIQHSDGNFWVNVYVILEVVECYTRDIEKMYADKVRELEYNSGKIIAVHIYLREVDNPFSSWKKEERDTEHV